METHLTQTPFTYNEGRFTYKLGYDCFRVGHAKIEITKLGTACMAISLNRGTSL